MPDSNIGWVWYQQFPAPGTLLHGVWSTENNLFKQKHGFVVQPWNVAEEPLFLQIQDSQYHVEISLLSNLVQQALQNQTFAHTYFPIEDFVQYVNHCIQEIEKGNFEKAVAARNWFFPYIWNEQNILKAITHFVSMATKGLKCIVYHPAYGVWIGNSPEILCEGNSNQLLTMSLAGTVSEKDKVFTEKEKSEQQIVTNFVVETIRQCGGENILRDSTDELQNEHLKHLHNKITFSLPKEKIWPYVQALHPTPAVGGFPKAVALQWIAKSEKWERRWYSGWWGYFNEKEIHFYVNLRCAKWYQNGLETFAGCGINHGSEAMAELDETNEKMKVILKSLGLIKSEKPGN